MRVVSLSTARRTLPELISIVERGEGVLITRRGRPIAQLSPYAAGKEAEPEWQDAYRRMMARLDEGASLGGLRLVRDDLYAA